jgi:TldD protein
MSQIQDVARELADLITKAPADYTAAIVEESESSTLTYRGRELEATTRNSAVGGNIRACVRGGWGFVTFDDLGDLAGKVSAAGNQAGLAGRESSELAAAPVVREVVPARFRGNPVAVPLAEKKKLLDGFNELIWQTPKIKTSVIGYGDSRRKRIFVNSAGSYIEQELADVTLRVNAIAAAGNEVQQAGLSLGTTGDITPLSHLEKEIKDLAGKAVAMLDAPQVKGGEYTVVLDPVLAGVFVHEAFGHLSESDFIYENERLKEIMTLGKQFGPPGLNIVDGAAVPGLRGSYDYDDEGEPATKTYLIREGRLVGRLHSRETAARMHEAPTGNARAVSYRFPPIVRMTNTYIEPRDATFNNLIADIKEGIYAKNWYGGTTSMEMFTFSAGEAYMIRNGQIAEQIRPVVLTGNIFATLLNIEGIGNDLEMNQGGGCGKSGQSGLPVSNGSPHIRIGHCLVGGC